METTTRRQTSCRVSIRDLEGALRTNNVPFVLVREVQRAVFRGSTAPEATALDFIVYQAGSPNLLVSTKPRNPQTARAMSEWQGIFGQDFQAVFARWSAMGHFQARNVNGQRRLTEIDDLATAKGE